jgi:hypothetical protein
MTALRPGPSRTTAKRQSHRESSMYHRGSGWVLSTWDDQYGCARLSGERPYAWAQEHPDSEKSQGIVNDFESYEESGFANDGYARVAVFALRGEEGDVQ